MKKNPRKTPIKAFVRTPRTVGQLMKTLAKLDPATCILSYDDRQLEVTVSVCKDCNVVVFDHVYNAETDPDDFK